MRGRFSFPPSKFFGIFGIKGEQPMEQNYNHMKKFAYDNDNNCCTVIATAIAFNQPFEKVQKDFFEKGYRKKGRGFYFFRAWLKPILD